MSGEDPLVRSAALAHDYLATLPEQHVGPTATAAQLRAALGGPLPEHGEEPAATIEALAAGAAPGLVASAGPRYFGFVVGGSVPAALAADWLTSAWDQTGALWASSPAAGAAEETVGRWALELLDLPRDAGFGIATGATMANFTGLAAGRGEVLRRVGWEVEEDGLHGAPPIRIVAGEAAHATLILALRYTGLGGRRRLELVPADGEGRMRPAELERVLGAGSGPAIVCAQAGEVNSGAFDPLGEVADIAHAHGAWCHVDGAFGLWARAAPGRAHLAAGAEKADSWAVDAHKWLNVPYDAAFAIVADAAAQRAALGAAAAYLPPARGEERSGWEFAPEASRRARAFPSWAAIRSLGRSGVAELVERCCVLATRMADQLEATPGVEILNDVVLNQILVAFGDDARTHAVIDAVQREGTCWAGGSTWRGRAVMRISVSNWSTTEADADRSIAAILRVAAAT